MENFSFILLLFYSTYNLDDDDNENSKNDNMGTFIISRLRDVCYCRSCHNKLNRVEKLMKNMLEEEKLLNSEYVVSKSFLLLVNF